MKIRSLLNRHLLFAFAVLCLFPAVGADAAVSAMAVFVEGEVSYTSAADMKTESVKKGQTFAQGDHVVTGPDGKVEIEFESGALLLLDNNTDITIKILAKSDKGAVSAIFDLAIGKIKSSFSLITGASAEYHTKAAIVGIAGTPEHIIEAGKTAEGVDKTSAYLLGQKGDEGALFAQGFDPDKTRVIITPGQGTTVLAGLAPAAPFLLTPEILKSIGNMIFQSGSSAGAAAGGVSAAAIGGGAAAVAGIAAVAGGASGGDSGDGHDDDTDNNGHDTSGPTEPPDPAGPADTISGTWSGSGVWEHPADCHEAGAVYGFSCTLTQSGSSFSGGCTISDESFTVTGTVSGDGGSFTGTGGVSASGTISGNSMSGTWSDQAVCGAPEGTDGVDDHLETVGGSFSATKN